MANGQDQRADTEGEENPPYNRSRHDPSYRRYEAPHYNSPEKADQEDACLKDSAQKWNDRAHRRERSEQKQETEQQQEESTESRKPGKGAIRGVRIRKHGLGRL